jgi:tRNA modification GTPase
MEKVVENLEDTIVAISTGSSAGAISIVRLSGPNAVNIADQIFESNAGKKPSEFSARYLELGKAKTKNFTEQAMCVVFFAPKSYTGQNLVEIQCHGGLKIAQGIVAECISRGARAATNGEFTKRAFVNGKISLASAEGIADMINAETDAQIRAGYNLLNGKLSTFAGDAQAELTDLLSEIEVSFDYPEEQIEYITKKNVESRLQKLAENMRRVLDTAGTGQIISNGINVLIVGKPNVGKSSLLNAMIDRERALVTDVPGTTRDTIEDTLSINGIKVNIIDTAGIHQTTDLVVTYKQS